MTRSQRDWTTAIALLSVGLMALPPAEAARLRHRSHGHSYKRTVSQHAVLLAQDPDIVGALASTVESLDPAILTQPIAVIATRSNGLVRVVVETPPRGALASAGRPVVLATASYRGDEGSMEAHPERAPEVSGRLDLSLPMAAGTAIEQTAAAGSLTAAFVLIVQPAGRGYNVIFAPIPYSVSKLTVVSVTTVSPEYSTPVLPGASPQVPALPPVDQPAAPPSQPANS